MMPGCVRAFCGGVAALSTTAEWVGLLRLDPGNISRYRLDRSLRIFHAALMHLLLVAELVYHRRKEWKFQFRPAPPAK
jgi:hypothetical protein